MTDQQTENREYLEQINFGDGEPAPEEEPTGQEEAQASSGEEAERQETPPAPDPETEQMARDIGWRPKDEWKGDPEKWVDAESFLSKGEKLLPVLKADRKRLFKETAELRQQLKDFQDYHKADRERVAKREYERGLRDIKARQLQAVEEGDTEAFEQTEREREALEKSYTEETAEQEQAKPDGKAGAENLDRTHYEAWERDNGWYGKDHEATEYARAIVGLVQKRGGYKGDERELYDAVTDEVKARYPEKFRAKANPRRNEAQGVEGSETLGGRSGSGKKTFADLPPDAKAECMKLEKAGLKRAEFVAEYFGTEAITFGD